MTEQTYEQILAQDIQKLNELILQIHEYAAKLQEETKWSIDQDIRIRMFKQLQSLVETYWFSVSFFSFHMEHSACLRELIPDQDPELKFNAIKSFEKMTKNGFFYSLMSVLEGVIRTLVRNLSDKPGNEPFWKERESLEGLLPRLSKDGFSDLLELLPTIRNCIHNNGIHVSSASAPLQFKRSYKRYTFKFQNLKRIRYAKRSYMILYAQWVFELFCFLVEDTEIRSRKLINDVSATAYTETNKGNQN